MAQLLEKQQELFQKVKSWVIYHVIKEPHLWAFIQQNQNQDLQEVFQSLLPFPFDSQWLSKCPLMDNWIKKKCGVVWFNTALRKKQSV